jgi:hypothetical protein
MMAAADTPEEPRQVRDPPLTDAIIPLVTVMVLIAGMMGAFLPPRPVVVTRRLRPGRR